MANFIFCFAVTLVFIFFLQITSVAAIYCFQCNSLYDPDCENIQPNDTSSPHYKICEPPEESIGKEIFCRKIVQTIYDRDGMVRTIRKCGWVMHQRECYMVSNKGHQDISCQCFHDGCNTGHTSFSSLLVLSSTLLLHLFKNGI